MFSSAFANLLQYFSFPAELIGVILAYVEIRHPGLSRQLSTRIAEYGKRNAEVSFKDHIPVSRAIAPIAFFLLISFLIIIFDLPNWVIYGPFAVLVFVLIALFIAAFWIPERALGTVGLMIAGVGLLIEMYQVLVMLIPR